MSSLSVQIHPHDGATRVVVGGELDLGGALIFERELRRAEREAARLLVLDLRSLRFMDSTGLRLVLNAHARAERRGCRLMIIEGGEPVRRLFRLAGVGDRLELFADLPA